MAKVATDQRVTDALIGLVRAAGLEPENVGRVSLTHGDGQTQVEVRLFLTDGMADALVEGLAP